MRSILIFRIESLKDLSWEFVHSESLEFVEHVLKNTILFIYFYFFCIPAAAPLPSLLPVPPFYTALFPPPNVEYSWILLTFYHTALNR